MRHGEVGVDIDPRDWAIAVRPLNAIALARTTCRGIAGIAGEQKLGRLIEDEKADRGIEARHDLDANAGVGALRDSYSEEPTEYSRKL